MGVSVIAVYRPKPGMQGALDAEMVGHVPLLRRLGLATAMPSTVLRAGDGSILEHFEWVDHAAIETAHSHPEVLAMWERFGECCDFATLADLPNASTMFAEFEYVDSY
ncbi:hypothetical protein [Ilumatobacter sp.]|uniref:hypothetical protein n=1 Tax=Ilumatobacter sp. TaxID=1967498 RepID=UPI003C4ECB0A